MASIGISEFTFGFAFLYEQTHANWKGIKAAPILPSLQKEKDAGWDAHLPARATDFYYQFKLSERLSAWNAKYIQNGIYADPYYRISLHRRSKNQQHRRLRKHAQANRHTYYVAPEFDTIDDFNAAFLSKQIKDKSRLIPLRRCKDVKDGKQHDITFQTGKKGWKQHSEIHEGDESFSGRELERVYRETRGEWRALDEGFARTLFERTSEVVAETLELEGVSEARSRVPLLDFNPHDAGRDATLLRTAEILSVSLGVTLVLVGSDE